MWTTRRAQRAARRGGRRGFSIGSLRGRRSGSPGRVQLIVTSPPFLDVVDYATDNWLRGWFCGLDVDDVPIERARAARGLAARSSRPRSTSSRGCCGRAASSRSRSARCAAAGSGWRTTVVPCGVAAGLEPVCVAHQPADASPRPRTSGACSNNAQGHEHEPHRGVSEAGLTRRLRTTPVKPLPRIP